jgi:hypothetical protein
VEKHKNAVQNSRFSVAVLLALFSLLLKQPVDAKDDELRVASVAAATGVV